LTILLVGVCKIRKKLTNREDDNKEHRKRHTTEYSIDKTTNPNNKKTPGISRLMTLGSGDVSVLFTKTEQHPDGRDITRAEPTVSTTVIGTVGRQSKLAKRRPDQHLDMRSEAPTLLLVMSLNMSKSSSSICEFCWYHDIEPTGGALYTHNRFAIPRIDTHSPSHYASPKEFFRNIFTQEHFK